MSLDRIRFHWREDFLSSAVRLYLVNDAGTVAHTIDPTEPFEPGILTIRTVDLEPGEQPPPFMCLSPQYADALVDAVVASGRIKREEPAILREWLAVERARVDAVLAGASESARV